jgi:hypothetical protein
LKRADSDMETVHMLSFTTNYENEFIITHDLILA